MIWIAVGLFVFGIIWGTISVYGKGAYHPSHGEAGDDE